MSTGEKIFCRRVTLSMVASLVSSMAIMLGMLGEINVVWEKAMQIVVTILFWVGLAAEQFLIWTADSYRKRNASQKIDGRPGVAEFFKTDIGTYADIAFVVSLIVFIVFFVCEWGQFSVQYVLLFLIVFAFRIHCIANGKNYRYKKYFLKVGEVNKHD